MLKWIKRSFSKNEELDEITGLPKNLLEEKFKSNNKNNIEFSEISPTLFTEDVVVVSGSPAFIDFEGDLRRSRSFCFESEVGMNDGLIRFMGDVNKAIRQSGYYYVQSVRLYERGKWVLRGCIKNKENEENFEVN